MELNIIRGRIESMSNKSNLDRLLSSDEFVWDELSETNSLMIIRTNGNDPVKVKESFLKFYADTCASYIEQMFEDYPESEYDYECLPDGSIEKCKSDNTDIVIEFSPITLDVYGRGIPQFYDFGDYFVRKLDKGFINETYPSIKYELFLKWSQDTGPSVDTFRDIYTNDDSCDFEWLYGQFEQEFGKYRLEELVESSDSVEESIDEYGDDLEDDVEIFVKKVPFDTLRDIFQMKAKSWEEYNEEELFDDYSDFVYELLLGGFPDEVSFEEFEDHYDTNLSEAEYQKAIAKIKVLLDGNKG